MSTIISSGKLEDQFLDAISFSSIAANAGDKLYLLTANNAGGGKNLSPFTWGAQTSTLSDSISNSLYIHELIVSATGTNNISASWDGYTNYNAVYVLVRPTTQFDAALSPVVKQWWADFPSGGLGSFANPSLTSASLGANGRVFDVVLVAGENKGGVDLRPTSSTTTTTLVQSALHLSKYPNQTQVSTATGSGAVASGYSITANAVFFYMQVAVKETSFTVTSINGGSPIRPGATVAVVTNGFTVKPTTAQGVYPGGTISATIGTGTTNSFNMTIANRANGAPWPADGTSVTWTFSNGVPESASGTQSITIGATETKQVFAGSITDDQAYVTYWLNADGLVCDGGEFDYIPYGGTGLTVDADGRVRNATAGTLNTWFRPSGTSSNVYQYIFTINNAGLITSAKKGLAIGIGIGIGF